jgi:hypothetical protein
VVAVLTAIPSATLASIELFEVDPVATSLTLQGSTSGAVFQEQSAGSLTTTCHGWVVADLGASTIQLVAGSAVVLDQTNLWQPGSHGSTQATPAAYGVKATSGSGIGVLNEVAALRNVAFDLSSPPMPTDHGQFDSSGLTLSVPAGADATLDYRVDHLVVIAGNRGLDGLNAPDAAGTATLSLLAEVQTVAIPVDLPLVCQTVATDDTQLRFTGQVVARRGIMILKPQLLWIVSPTNRQELTLVWASSYKLQRATTLSPPDWTDVPAAAPVTVSSQGTTGFFRVVAGP